jgi:AcrR family transcriptional regulator
MAAPRRMGTETSETRAELLDITERVMVEDGYAAVSSRRIANEAGVTAALVHYYFGTIDDLFIAVLRRRAEQQLARQERFLNSARPLRSWWRFASDPAGTALLLEFMALSNHRKSIRGELAAYAERFRQQQVELLSHRIEEYGVDTKDIPPVAVLVVIDSIGKTVVMEEAIGVHTGLRETIDVVERYLDRIEGPADAKEHRRPRKTAPGRRSTKKQQP